MASHDPMSMSCHMIAMAPLFCPQARAEKRHGACRSGSTRRSMSTLLRQQPRSDRTKAPLPARRRPGRRCGRR
eukprot:1952706-Rhodomonas_salina.2